MQRMLYSFGQPVWCMWEKSGLSMCVCVWIWAGRKEEGDGVRGGGGSGKGHCSSSTAIDNSVRVKQELNGTAPLIVLVAFVTHAARVFVPRVQTMRNTGANCARIARASLT